jgi:peptide/nickel transport system permease protein
MTTSHPKRRSLALQTLIRVFHSKLAVTGLALLFIIVLLTLLAPFLTQYDPGKMDLANANLRPSWQHLAGTDQQGRDILTRLLYGGRYSLVLGLSGALLSTIIGVVFGAFAGYFGKWVDNGIMRFMDVLQAIPGILIAILIAAVLGGGFWKTVIALTVGGIVPATRITRGQILGERTREYVEAAESINSGKLRIMFSEILPNTLSPLIVHTTTAIGGTILVAASLSFLGFGVRPPTPEWGAMVTEGIASVLAYPHIILFPGLAIVITVLAVSIFGDGLRDALDPKMKR